MNQATDLTLPGLVHDLNNVFQTLGVAADLLSADPQWAPISEAILRSIERGKGIATSMQQTGLLDNQPPAALENIVANAMSFAQDSLLGGYRPEIRFISSIEPGIELRRMWAWERVLINLFANSMRAMPAGGAIHILAHTYAGHAEIVVRDEGTGIAPEILADMFRAHVSTKQQGGLGLYIVETIVKQAGGEVRAANRTDGPGAEFVITLPAEQSLVQAAQA